MFSNEKTKVIFWHEKKLWKCFSYIFYHNSAYSCQKQRISIFKPDIVLIFYYQILIIGIFENLNFLTFWVSAHCSYHKRFKTTLDSISDFG